MTCRDENTHADILTLHTLLLPYQVSLIEKTDFYMMTLYLDLKLKKLFDQKIFLKAFYVATQKSMKNFNILFIITYKTYIIQ